MIPLILAPFLFGVAAAALRREDVRWRFAVPLALIPAAMAFFLLPYGCLAGAALAAAYWKIRLP